MRSKSNWKMSAILAAFSLVIAVVLAGCPMDDAQEGGNDLEARIPTELVGSWGSGTVEILRINADGTGTIQGNVARWSVNGNRLTLTQDLGAAHGGEVSGSAAWAIVGGRLRLSEGEGFLGMMLENLPDIDRLGGDNEVSPGNGAPTITGILISPFSPVVTRGGSQNFSATVTGTNNPPQGVTWSIDQPDKHEQTTISASGVLTVASAETLTTLTVRATSTFNTMLSGIATVTVYICACACDSRGPCDHGCDDSCHDCSSCAIGCGCGCGISCNDCWCWPSECSWCDGWDSCRCGCRISCDDCRCWFTGCSWCGGSVPSPYHPSW